MVPGQSSTLMKQKERGLLVAEESRFILREGGRTEFTGNRSTVKAPREEEDEAVENPAGCCDYAAHQGGRMKLQGRKRSHWRCMKGGHGATVAHTSWSSSKHPF